MLRSPRFLAASRRSCPISPPSSSTIILMTTLRRFQVKSCAELVAGEQRDSTLINTKKILFHYVLRRSTHARCATSTAVVQRRLRRSSRSAAPERKGHPFVSEPEVPSARLKWVTARCGRAVEQYLSLRSVVEIHMRCDFVRKLAQTLACVPFEYRAVVTHSTLYLLRLRVS